MVCIIGVAAVVEVSDDVVTLTHSIAQGTLEHEEQTLYNYNGSGILTYFWFAGNWEGLNETLFKIYIDDQYEISFSYYLGMGIGFGQEDAWGTRLMGKGSITSGVFNTYKIPFGVSVRISAQLPPSVTRSKVPFWFVVRGLTGIHNVELSGVRLPKGARLYLDKVENVQLKPLDFIEYFQSNRSGLILQMTMATQSGNTHHMEGCIRMYPHKAQDFYTDPFLLLSSGTEDYFGTAWGFRERKDNPLYHFELAGLTSISPTHDSFSAYKIHLEDPLIFSRKEGVRLTWRNGDTVDPETGLKCVNLYGKPKGEATKTTVTFYVWSYQW